VEVSGGSLLDVSIDYIFFRREVESSTAVDAYE